MNSTTTVSFQIFRYLLFVNHPTIRTDFIYIFRRQSGQLSRYSDSLRAGRSRDRIPERATFFAPVQTGPEAHPVSCKMGDGPFPKVKRPQRGTDTHLLLMQGCERIEALFHPSGPAWACHVVWRLYSKTKTVLN